MKSKWVVMASFLVIVVGMVTLSSTQMQVFMEQVGVTKSVTVVIDSGHGGADPGKVGGAGTLEKDINLAIAKKVEAYLKSKKIPVVMTRTSDEGLYDEGDSNKKISDLQRRVARMEKSKPAFCISIHQNSYTDSSCKGAQVFYYKGSNESKEMAEILQEKIKETIGDDNHRQTKADSSYYLLKNTTVPIVIVECGFLSNPQEEKLLQDENYQKKVAKGITEGIMTIRENLIF